MNGHLQQRRTNGSSASHHASNGMYVPPHLRKQQQAEADAQLQRHLQQKQQQQQQSDSSAAANTPASVDRSTVAQQRQAWEHLHRTLTGLINKASISNLPNLLPELFALNLVRGRGLFVAALLQSESAALHLTPVYAAAAAVVNTKLPETGELLCTRLLSSLKVALANNDRLSCNCTMKFLAALANQRVLHELAVLQLQTLLLEQQTDSSITLVCQLTLDCGQLLHRVAPKALHAVMEQLRTLLHDTAAELSTRTLYDVEQVLQAWRTRFDAHSQLLSELDLVEEAEQITHELLLDDDDDEAMRDDDADPLQLALNRFEYDPQYEENEAAYAEIRAEILGENDEEEANSVADEDAPPQLEDDTYEHQPAMEADAEDEDQIVDLSKGDASAPEHNTQLTQDEAQQALAAQSSQTLVDGSDTALINLRRTIYLTIMSSIDFEECAHKLMKLKLSHTQQEAELCNMLLECCSVERTYLRFYGLLGARFCSLRNETRGYKGAKQSSASSAYRDAFEDCFAKHYALIHRFETNRLRNLAKLFAHLLCCDALPWSVMEYIRLTEEDTTSAGRIFVKVLFRELSETLGLASLRQRLLAPEMRPFVEGILPHLHDNEATHDDTAAPVDHSSAKHLRFAINYFTSIGLGGLTDELRVVLKDMPRRIMEQQQKLLATQAQLKAEQPSAMDSGGSSASDSESGSESESSRSSRSRSRSRSTSSRSSFSSSSSASRSEGHRRTASRSRYKRSRSRSRSSDRDRKRSKGATSGRRSSRRYSSSSRSRSRSRSLSSSRSRSRSSSVSPRRDRRDRERDAGRGRAPSKRSLSRSVARSPIPTSSRPQSAVDDRQRGDDRSPVHRNDRRSSRSLVRSPLVESSVAAPLAARSPVHAPASAASAPRSSSRRRDDAYARERHDGPRLESRSRELIDRTENRRNDDRRSDARRLDSRPRDQERRSDRRQDERDYPARDRIQDRDPRRESPRRDSRDAYRSRSRSPIRRSSQVSRGRDEYNSRPREDRPRFEDRARDYRQQSRRDDDRGRTEDHSYSSRRTEETRRDRDRDREFDDRRREPFAAPSRAPAPAIDPRVHPSRLALVKEALDRDAPPPAREQQRQR